jgi:LPS export ABC transporter protein LptC
VRQAARYARWAAAAAILLVLIVAATYLHRARRAAEEQRKVPPAVPSTVQQRSAEFAFSKVEKDRTLFTVRASRATEYKKKNRSLLEDVWITIYGRAGERNDNIHTRECSFEQTAGRIVCQGEVQLDLQAAAGAGAGKAAGPAIHLDTRDVSFDRNTGVAATREPVRFSFSGGQGRATGLTYRSRDAVIALGGTVELTLSGRPDGKAPENLHVGAGPDGNAPESLHVGAGAEASRPAPPLFVTAGGLSYRRRQNLVVFAPPIRARQGGRELTAASIAVLVDAGLHPRSATVSGGPEIVTEEKTGRIEVRADRFLASFGAASRLERLMAEGHVRANRAAAAASDSLVAGRAEISFGGNLQPQAMLAEGAVEARSESAGRSARLETSRLQLEFSPGARGRSREVSRAETPAGGTLVWKTSAEALRVAAGKLAAEFDPRGAVRRLRGTAGARIARQTASGPRIESTSQGFAMDFAGGQWAAIRQTGDVVLREDAVAGGTGQGARTATADGARFVRATGTVLLTGNAAVADAESRTQADLVLFDQARDEVRAQGNVRTSYFSASGANAVGLGQGPAYIVAARLAAEAKTGQAVYSGGVRLWQGDAVIQADSVALDRRARELDARGHVTGAFLEAPARSGKGERRLYRVRAARLLYRAAQGRAWLEGGASAVSAQAGLTAPTIELFFERAGNGAPQLARASATGGVTLRQAPAPGGPGQGARWASAARGDYDAAEDKIVLSGGSPTLHDASGDVVTGRQLTLFLASDTILVVSDEGARTLTRYRIAK